MSNRNILSFKNWYLWKIGISNAPTLRAQQVSDSIQEKSGKPFPIRIWIKIPLFSARFIEGKAHRIFEQFRSKRIPYGSSGYTEWFTAFNAITALLIFWLAPNFPYKSAFCLAFFFAPIPIDFICLCFAMAAAEWLLVFWVLGKCFAVDFIGGIYGIVTYLLS